MGSVMGQADIARLLGVTRGQVHMWAQRRGTSGFPNPVHRDKPGRPAYDVDAVVDWYSRWDPNKNRGAHWAEKKRKGKTTVRRKHG